MELDSHKLLGGSGTPADTTNFTEFVQKNLKLYELNNDLNLTTKGAANYTRGEVSQLVIHLFFFSCVSKKVSQYIAIAFSCLLSPTFLFLISIYVRLWLVCWWLDSWPRLCVRDPIRPTFSWPGMHLLYTSCSHYSLYESNLYPRTRNRTHSLSQIYNAISPYTRKLSQLYSLPVTHHNHNVG